MEPRDEARLLDTRDMSDHTFVELPSLLRPGDLVVINETRVRAARLRGRQRDTGGRVELLLLERDPEGVWNALARPARRLRPGTVIDLESLSAHVVGGGERGEVFVTLEAHDEEGAIAAAGEVPLPPYFTGRLDDPERYQTIFARAVGSAAAPTAGLHFTESVLAGLHGQDIRVAGIDLHVSLDTFRPMSGEEVEEHRMHSEWCAVPEATAREVAAARRRGGRVVAVGTTVVRTLESRHDGAGGVVPGEGRSDLFLRPGRSLEVVDILITNFHLPGSTLLVLLAAVVGDRWREIYSVALKRGYRFLSFGDAMLAERASP